MRPTLPGFYVNWKHRSKLSCCSLATTAWQIKHKDIFFKCTIKQNFPQCSLHSTITKTTILLKLLQWCHFFFYKNWLFKYMGYTHRQQGSIYCYSTRREATLFTPNEFSWAVTMCWIICLGLKKSPLNVIIVMHFKPSKMHWAPSLSNITQRTI